MGLLRVTACEFGTEHATVSCRCPMEHEVARDFIVCPTPESCSEQNNKYRAVASSAESWATFEAVCQRELGISTEKFIELVMTYGCPDGKHWVKVYNLWPQ